jgi:glycosyltransferase involved in cell wall biosynthesis
MEETDVNSAQTEERLRIAWVYPSSFDDTLDAATYLDTTRELRQMGCDVTLIAVGPDGPSEYRGVEVWCVSQPDVYLIRQLLFHLKVVRWLLAHHHQLDAILFHEISTLWLLPLRLLRGSRRPALVVDTRTLNMPREDTLTLRIRLRGAYLNLMMRLANRWADGRTAITRRMAEVVNIPERRLWGVWPSGVRLEQFAPPRQQRRWPTNDEPVCIVYVGAMEYERGLMTLCRAVVRAQVESMRFNLTLVGDGRERAELEAFAARHDCIRVLAPVPHQQIPELLCRAHIGVLPFPDEVKFQVSSPIKLFEYMAAGLPILATRIACHTDVIGGDDIVFWADRADEDGLVAALRQAWAARDALEIMGARSLAAAEHWTWQAAAQKLKQAIQYGQARRS